MTGVLVAILAGFISVSVVRAESKKTRINSMQYRLTATAPRELIAQTLAHIKGERKAPVEVLPIAVRFIYTVKHHAAQPAAWDLISLGREQRPTLRNSREINVLGESYDSSARTWLVEQEIVSPPEQLLHLLHSNANSDALTSIRTATALTPDKLATLDGADAYARKVPEGKQFAITVLPGSTKVTGQDGKPLKTQ